MHRFYVPPGECKGPIITLGESEAAHALVVLRVRPEDHATVLDGTGHEFICQVTSATRHAVALRVLERHDRPRSSYRLTLFQAVTKSRSMDQIIQKATELGTHRIVPFLAERTVVKLSAGDDADKAAKWRALAVEAIKQSGAPWLPAIETPGSLQSLLACGERFELVLVGSLQHGSKHPRECLASFRAAHGRAPSDVAVWIGPEGDFTSAELMAIQSSGAAPITLGPRVLRSDTAALYCLSVLNYELQAP